MSPERVVMEEAYDEFKLTRYLPPTCRELQAHLGVIVKRNINGDGQGDEFSFRGFESTRKTFQNRFDQIKKDRIKGLR